MDFIDKVKGFLFEPSDTLSNSREDPLNEALKYYITLVIIYSVLNALIQIFFGEIISPIMGNYSIISGAEVKKTIFMSIYHVLYAIPGLFISAVFLDICVSIAGGKKGLNQTIKALVYTSTPSLLFGWIPVINVLAVIWSLVLNIIGIREFHEISIKRAFAAVVIPIVSILLIAAFFSKAIFLPGIKIPLS